MKILPFSQDFWRVSIGFLVISLVLLQLSGSFGGLLAVRAADSIDQLKKQADALEQKAKQAEKEATKQKTVAERAADKVHQVATQINNLEGSIVSTEQEIQKTQGQIGDQNQKIASLESDLRSIKDKQAALVREMYKIRLSLPDDLMVFSDEPIGVREQRQQQFVSLKKSVAGVYAKTTTAKDEVEHNRNDLVKKSENLQSLKTRQDEQKRGLADYKYAQAQLKENAEDAVVRLENQAKQARLEEQKVEAKISAALSAIIAQRSRKTAFGNPNIDGRNVGQKVTRGALIGHMGRTGFSTGPHVHFEVRLNNVPVNPQPYINNGTLSVPVNNYTISQGFGYTDYAASGAYGGGIHTGIDFAGPYGQAVYAPADGVVIMNQYYGGYGYAWAMQLDNGLVVLAGHMTGK